MLKLVGALLILGTCAGVGGWQAWRLRARPRLLAELQAALALLATQVGYGAVPLPEALEAVGSGVPAGAAGRLFTEAGQQLRQAQGEPAAKLWRRSVEKWLPETVLLPEEGEALMRLALGLGEAPREEQLRSIYEVQRRLQALEVTARDVSERMTKVWSYGGVLTGLAVIVTIW
ncbi:stage III sporulation protein AB [Heliophilum fasciatum]|uniref:Stage III sporulation protein AB n=1 Tax=Heliophilum fasciatum TaxID=35700 RepID=A0A4R2RSF0_9FIRM|nr:stage III sporulation protein AB [Heliophilum fasciatum]MCW2277323.1 stage III sporulation protein AB [Heliophilum fasciatum]TCP67160.1 stage III sporulation protein AB [Heliophilum fasciatum]